MKLHSVKEAFFRDWGNKTIKEFFEENSDINPVWLLEVAVLLSNPKRASHVVNEDLIQEFIEMLNLEAVNLVDKVDVMRLKLTNFDKLLLAPEWVREILTKEEVTVDEFKKVENYLKKKAGE
jgi:hypothetical protein